MATCCLSCNKDVKRAEKVIQCAICKGKVHEKCTNLTDEQIILLKASKNILYHCNACVNNTWTQQLQENNNNLELCLATVSEVQKAVNKLVDMNEQMKTKENVTTYADKVKVNKAIVIQPINKQDNTVTTRFITENLKPSELGIGINGLKNMKEGGVLINVQDEKAKRVITDKLDQIAGNVYDIVDVEAQDQKMILLGVEKEYLMKSDEETLHDLVIQNNLAEIDQDIEVKLKIIKKISSKVNDNVHIVIGIKNELNCIFKKFQKLYLGYKYCKLTDYINVIRCFKCYRFGHKKINCSNAICCGICAKDHDTKDCHETVKKCINCVTACQKNGVQYDVGHSSFDRKCPSFVKLVDRLKSKKKPL